MEKITLFAFTLFFLIPFNGQPQTEQQPPDSLLSILKTAPDEAHLAPTLYEIARHYYNVDDIDQALDYSQQLLKNSQRFKQHQFTGRAYILLGSIYKMKGKKEETLANFLNALTIFEKTNDIDGLADSYLHIGGYYYNLEAYDKAIEYYKKSLPLFIQLKDKSGESFVLNNIGSSFQMKDDQKNARLYLKSALKLLVEMNAPDEELAETRINIGNTYYSEENYTDALKEFEDALVVLRKTTNETSTAICLVNMGVMNNKLGKPALAKGYFEEAINLLDKMGNIDLMSIALEDYAQCLIALNKPVEAFHALEQKIALDDSLNNKYLMDQIAEMSEKYESDKKQQEIMLLTAKNKNAEQKNQIQELDNLKQKAELDKSNTILYFSLGGVALLIAFAVMLINRNRLKSIVNKQLTSQKEEILKAKLIIEQKNKDILDSILYAKKIQDAILHEENKALRILPEHFVLFKPKDIVSGDFYWTLEKENCWYAAVADCTGHGVPGAFMSMLGIAFLNEITKANDDKSPAQILNELRDKVIRELGQSGNIGENKDGMDITLIKLDQKRRLLEFAGAQNSLLITRNNDLIQLPADKQPIGYQIMQKPFSHTEFEIQKGDTLYLLSDGYADQFGGEKKKSGAGKKFKMTRFKEMVLHISPQALTDQKNFIEDTFNRWKGDNEQIDDVCVMGIRL